MKYTEKYNVTSHDVDVNNNLRPSLILRYMQETANHQMRDRKPSYYDLFFAGKSFILIRITLEVLEQIHQYEEIEVATWCSPSKGATFNRCFEILRDGKVAARAYSQWTITAYKENRICKISEVDVSRYESDAALEMNLPLKFHLSKDDEFAIVGHKKVLASSIDMNRHMNNTNYPDMLWECIPDVLDKEVTSLNVRFMHEAPLGADVDIFMSSDTRPSAEDRMADQSCRFRTKVADGTNIEAIMGLRNRG